MRSAIEPPDTRPPLKSAFDNTAGMPDNERTWAAGDQNTRALGVALKRQLSEPGGSGSSQPPSASGHGDDNVKGAIEFEEEKVGTFIGPSCSAPRQHVLSDGGHFRKACYSNNCRTPGFHLETPDGHSFVNTVPVLCHMPSTSVMGCPHTAYCMVR